jgi:hypothetical protein
MKKSTTLLALLAGAVGAYAQGTIIWGDYIGNFGITVYSPQIATPTVEQMGNTSYDLSSQGYNGNTPGANTVYTGTPLGGSATGTGPTAYENGNLWTIALYAAPGINNTSGVQAAEAANAYSVTSLFNNSGGTGVANAGINGNDSAGAWSVAASSAVGNLQALGSGAVPWYINAAPNALYPNTAFSSSGTVQLLVWYNGGAQNLTYAQAAAAGAPYGASSFESLNPLGYTDSGILPNDPPDLAGGFIYGPVDLVLGDGIITSFSLVETPEPNTIVLGVIGTSAFLFCSRK